MSGFVGGSRLLRKGSIDRLAGPGYTGIYAKGRLKFLYTDGVQPIKLSKYFTL